MYSSSAIHGYSSISASFPPITRSEYPFSPHLKFEDGDRNAGTCTDPGLVPKFGLIVKGCCGTICGWIVTACGFVDKVCSGLGVFAGQQISS